MKKGQCYSGRVALPFISTAQNLGFPNEDIGFHGDAVIPGEPVFGGKLVCRIAHHLIETLAIQDPLTREDVERYRRAGTGHTDHLHRTIRGGERRGDVAVGGNRIRCGIYLDPGDIDVHIRFLAAGGIAHQDPGLHVVGIELVHPGEPVIRRELVEGNAHHFAETAASDGPFAAEDVDRCGSTSSCDTHHPHRSTDQTIEFRLDIPARLNIIRRGILLDAIDVDVHIGMLGGRRIAHQHPGLHVDPIVPGEPVFGRELVEGNPHHFIEAGVKDRAFAGKDVQCCGSACSADTHHPHRSTHQAIESWRDILTGWDLVRNATGRGVLLDATDVDVHIGILAGGGIAHQDPGLHVDAIVPGKPVFLHELVCRIAHHLIEAVPVHRPLARNKLLSIGAHYVHRSVQGVGVIHNHRRTRSQRIRIPSNSC